MADQASKDAALKGALAQIDRKFGKRWYLARWMPEWLESALRFVLR
jgi:hypothetical protein